MHGATGIGGPSRFSLRLATTYEAMRETSFRGRSLAMSDLNESNYIA